MNYFGRCERESDTINKKIIAVITLIITILSTISGCLQEKNTIYVGSTNADYSTIQEAINAAKNGTKIIVKSGSYNELITINKTITLIGEDKKTTIINFNPNYPISQVAILYINADNCSIENLQITLSNTSVIAQGISLNSNYNTIKNNIITNLADGIELSAYSESNTILHNEIKNNLIGIMASSSTNNNISYNILSNNTQYNIYSYNILSNNTQYNIYLSTDSNTNRVSFNIMKDSACGIRIKGSENNYVYTNCFQNNTKGIYCCCGARSNTFYQNTLLNNSDNANSRGLMNIWYDYPNGTGNYWDDYNGTDENHDGIGDIPYDIDDDLRNQDIHPLMVPPRNAPCGK